MFDKFMHELRMHELVTLEIRNLGSTTYPAKEVYEAIQSKITNCKDCKYYDKDNFTCKRFDEFRPEKHYCSYGERRENG